MRLVVGSAASAATRDREATTAWSSRDRRTASSRVLVEIERSSTGMPTGDYLVRVRPEASGATYDELRRCLIDAVDTLSSPS